MSCLQSTTSVSQEFQKVLDAELASLNVSLEATTPYVKGTNAVAETSVCLLKRAMKKAQQQLTLQ
jgi:hypothetical protein